MKEPTKIIGLVNRITEKYGVHCMKAVYNIQGTIDIELDRNIYYKEQEKMEKKIRRAIPNINDLYYYDTI